MNPLTEVREEIKQVLITNGFKAYDYMETRYTPPVALVIPDENYVSVREGDRFGGLNVSIQVLLIGPRMTEKTGTEKFDVMILDALKALDDSFDIVTVMSPSEVTVKEAQHYASVITIEVQININKYIKEDTE